MRDITASHLHLQDDDLDDEYEDDELDEDEEDDEEDEEEEGGWQVGARRGLSFL